MVAYKLDLNTAAVDQIGDQAALRLVTDVTRRTLNRATILTPVKTGRLRGGNHMRVQRDPIGIRGEVFNDTDYARYVHDGTRPHEILPKRARALRFKGKPRPPKAARGKGRGKRKAEPGIVYAARVRHPGTKARPWLATAVREIAEPAGFTVEV